MRASDRSGGWRRSPAPALARRAASARLRRSYRFRRRRSQPGPRPSGSRCCRSRWPVPPAGPGPGWSRRVPRGPWCRWSASWRAASPSVPGARRRQPSGSGGDAAKARRRTLWSRQPWRPCAYPWRASRPARDRFPGRRPWRRGGRRRYSRRVRPHSSGRFRIPRQPGWRGPARGSS